MTMERSSATDDGHRVLRFRPRTSAEVSTRQSSAHQPPGGDFPANDLSRYTTDREPDDYRHRMTMNAAAALFTLVLTGFGIWLAVSISDLRKTQDCILIGRRDCGRIPTPHSAETSGAPAPSHSH